MRGERATMGKSLLDVQRELKIKAAYIAAIENADPSAFDTPGFIAGYVRSYARYLNMDPDWAFETFCRESGFSTGGAAPVPATSRAAREEKAAAELRAAAQSLEDAIRRLPKSEPKSARAPIPSGPPGIRPDAALAPGRTPRPVAGRIRAGFGRQIDPEFKTATLRTGVEIEAPAGAPVQAIAPGRVLFAGWFRGYGQMVIVDHGGGDLSVSGYLDEVHVAAGDSVAAGQPIGAVGETGSASGPGLYFEIRHDGKAVDPTVWLAK
jgi:septal ring factor EnvC (AmiA/AmiB activator)